MLEDRMLIENDVCAFYDSSMCQNLRSYARQQLGDRYNVLICTIKSSNERNYVLFKGNSPIYESRIAENVWAEVDRIRIVREYV